MKKYSVPIIEDEDGELMIEFPDELMEAVNWNIGDTILWTDNEDGTWVLTKSNNP